MEKIFLETIKKTAENLLKNLGFAAKVDVIQDASMGSGQNAENKDNNLVCNIIIDQDSSFLIGQYGANLQSLQHILRLLVRKQIQEKVNFIVDVNSYRQQKTQAIIEQAEQAAKQAISEKRAVVLRPMSAYERRLVHLELSKNNEVTTESTGEGEARKVIIRPASDLIQ